MSAPTSIRRRLVAVAMVLLVAPFAASCAGDTGGDAAPVVEEVPTGVLGADAPRVGVMTAADIRVDGVLLAALLLGAGGDLEAAVAAGLVTPAEIDTAAAALADGTLAAWVAEAGAPAG